jgi:hypothetical protein
VVNGACLFWLERMRPLFFAIAIGAVVYEISVMRRHPPALRKWGTKALLWLSLAVNAIIICGWILITVRYW